MDALLGCSIHGSDSLVWGREESDKKGVEPRGAPEGYKMWH